MLQGMSESAAFLLTRQFSGWQLPPPWRLFTLSMNVFLVMPYYLEQWSMTQPPAQVGT
jgi:hypothetical protein